jgi:S1-C subfamily serine protease
MSLPPWNSFRSGFVALAFLILCHAIPLRLAAQGAPAGQVPEEVRGAKIYQLPTKSGKPAPNPGVYKSLAFKDINFDRLLLGLSISIRPVDRPATVERMYFQNVAINGIPLHMETFEQEFKLSKKESVDLPAPINCSIVFADLDSAQPLRDLVDKDTILITGESYIEVKLNSLEKLALRAKRVVIPVNLHEEVPLNFFQGNPLLRLTADKILDTLTNPTSTAAVAMAKGHLEKLRLDEMLGSKVKGALYLLCTQYTVRDPKSNASEQFSQAGTGFLVSADGKLLTTKRVIAPWKFDPQVDFLIEHQQLQLDQSSVKTYAWPAGTQLTTAEGDPNFAAALSTAAQSLKVIQIPPDELVAQSYQDPDSGERADLHLHAEGASDLALLQITGSNFQPLPLADSAASSSSDAKLVLSSYPTGTSQSQVTPRLLAVNVSLQAGLLTMEHKTDPGDSGAPLLNSDGKVVAMAGSEERCIPIEVVRKLIP